MLYNHLFVHSVLNYITHKKFTLEQKDKNQPINFKYQLYLMSLGFVQRALEKAYFYCIIVPNECKNVQILKRIFFGGKKLALFVYSISS